MVPAVTVVTAAPALAVSPPSGASAFSNLNTPQYTETDKTVVLTGQIYPAFAGRPVSLYKVNGDGTTTYVANDFANVSANVGTFTFAVTVAQETTFRFYSQAQTSGAITYGQTTSADFTVRSLIFFDDFDYADAAAMAQVWEIRNPTEYGSASTPHSKGSFDAVAFEANSSGGQRLLLKVVPDGTDPADGKRRFKVAKLRPKTLRQTYGYLEARIRFGSNSAFHGALWWQSGYGPGKGEMDIAEFFGNSGSGSQWMGHSFHNGPTVNDLTEYTGRSWTGSTGSPPAGKINCFQKANVATPSGYHTMYTGSFNTWRCRWEVDTYTLSIMRRDETTWTSLGTIGTDNGATPASLPAEIILSMNLNEPTYYDELVSYLAGGGDINTMTMRVEWIRAWI